MGHCSRSNALDPVVAAGEGGEGWGTVHVPMHWIPLLVLLHKQGEDGKGWGMDVCMYACTHVYVCTHVNL